MHEHCWQSCWLTTFVIVVIYLWTYLWIPMTKSYANAPSTSFLNSFNSFTRDVAPEFVGKHDFTHFSNNNPTADSHRSPVKHLTRMDIVEESGGLLRFEVEGSSFLYKQVLILPATYHRLRKIHCCRHPYSELARHLPCRLFVHTLITCLNNQSPFLWRRLLLTDFVSSCFWTMMNAHDVSNSHSVVRVSADRLSNLSFDMLLL